MSKVRKVIEIKGIVQGVGFRPFIYNLARKRNLKGWVNNTANGVVIDIEGEKDNINDFIMQIKNNPPLLSKINKILIKNKEIFNYYDFKIKQSNISIKPSTYISPDYCICNDCKNEIFDKNNRRYRYAFTNCTNCGPRFSIIQQLPYDRKATTMDEFTMCKECKDEYEDPKNRRFHAQPNACSKCGPQLWIENNCGNIVDIEVKFKDSIDKVLQLIKHGSILAVKGIGGFNLVCNAKDKEAIEKLRKRKARPTKPLAVMMKDLDTVKKYCSISDEEANILNSNRRPILLLEKLKACNLPDVLAPYNKRLGVMLPYTPMHYLMFDRDIDVLIMTSANISGEPMVYKNEEARVKLSDIVDYYLIHNRDINMPIDDSVSIFLKGKERLIRNGRGYAPKVINYETKKEILALGTELKDTISLSNKKDVFISEYIGDLRNESTMNTLENAIKYFTKVYNIIPKVVVYDMHPQFDYRNIKIQDNIEVIEVQHHHAHIVSCMAENNIKEEVIGIAFDGTGYGSDNRIWGGEFLICDRKISKRCGHLEYFNLVSGESAVNEPWRIAVSLLYKVFNENYEEYLPDHIKKKNYKIIKQLINRNINSPETSSMGRFFDGVSALIGFGGKVSFEGEAAIYMQNICNEDISDFYRYEIKENDEGFVLGINNIIINIMQDIHRNLDKSIIARKFHNTIIESTVDLSLRLREKYNINSVALSGGVFQNEILFNGICEKFKRYSFNIYTHSEIPCNDSGISLGQVVIANEIISK